MSESDANQQPPQAFRMGEPFTGKVLGITTHKGRLIVATDRGVFVCGDDDVFRPMRFEEPEQQPAERMTATEVLKLQKPPG